MAERVYEALRADLKSGVYAPGERIEASVAAMRLRTSVSPVRDTLHRLAGEGLVDMHTHGGFSVPHLTEVRLREQFEWAHQMAILALRWPTARPVSPPELPSVLNVSGVVSAIEKIMIQLGRRVPNGDIRVAVANSNIRLHRPRIVEVELIPTLRQDVMECLERWNANDLEGLADRLQWKHDRRKAMLPQIIERLLQSRNGDS